MAPSFTNDLMLDGNIGLTSAVAANVAMKIELTEIDLTGLTIFTQDPTRFPFYPHLADFSQPPVICNYNSQKSSCSFQSSWLSSPNVPERIAAMISV